jgi:hypothetical protein
MYNRRKEQPSIKSLLGTAGVFVVIIAFGMISLSTGDLLWFWPFFNELPEQITVQCYGESVVLEPNTNHFNEMTDVFNNTFSGTKNWDSLSLSDDTWQAYLQDEKMMVLILSYEEPVRVHSFYKYFSGVDTLIVPLDGRHARTNAVFGMTKELPAGGSLHVDNTTSISDYIFAQGLCSQPKAGINSSP